MDEFLALVVIGWSRAIESSIAKLLKNLGEALTPQRLAEVLSQSVLLAPLIFASVVVNHLVDFFQDLGNELSAVVPIELIRAFGKVTTPKNHTYRTVTLSEAELGLIDFIATNGIKLIQTQRPATYVLGRRLQTILKQTLTFPEWVFKVPGFSSAIFRLVDVVILLTIGVIRFASAVLVAVLLLEAKKGIEEERLFDTLDQSKQRKWTTERRFKRIP